MLYAALDWWLTRAPGAVLPRGELYWKHLPDDQVERVDVRVSELPGRPAQTAFGRTDEGGGVLWYYATLSFEARALPKHSLEADEVLSNIKRRMLQLRDGVGGSGRLPIYLPPLGTDMDAYPPPEVRGEHERASWRERGILTRAPDADLVYWAEVRQDAQLIRQDPQQRKLSALVIEVRHRPARAA